MLSDLLALAAAGALCAGCAAPAAETALSLDNPANAAASAVPFVRPVNVLATRERPATAAPSTAMRMSGGAMPGMAMPGMAMSGMTESGMTKSGPMAGMDHGAMPGMTMAQAQPSAGAAAATGVVNAVDAAKRSVNVSHQPIKALGWPAMTMDFPVAPSVDLNGIKAGDSIGFQLGQPDAGGNRRIERITPRPAAPGRPSQAMPGMDHGAMPGMAMPAQPQ